MLRIVALLFALAPGLAATADTVVPVQTVRSQTVLSPAHLAVIDRSTPGALSDPAQAVGMEARVVLYAGRPIRAEDIGPPALIERNQIVQLIYDHAGLMISTEGRSLARAAVGEQVRVMNLSSRTTVTGLVDATGRVFAGPPPAPSATE